ncbi:NUDIX domain-containing protein [Candidatus Dependentiae bacterium]|nr:NUDIX domain-containing protein [Candidatus Dependentiae bacterium]
MDEYLDIVNELDNVTGFKLRSDFYANGESNFRVINAFVKNSKGELWIPKRTASKKLFPLHLDVSVGGHVKSGESYGLAFERELAEELNININSVSHKEIGYFMPHKNSLSAFMKVYEISSNDNPNYNKEDFIDAFWIYPEDLMNLIKNGEKAKGDLPKLLNLCYGTKI